MPTFVANTLYKPLYKYVINAISEEPHEGGANDCNCKHPRGSHGGPPRPPAALHFRLEHLDQWFVVAVLTSSLAQVVLLQTLPPAWRTQVLPLLALPYLYPPAIEVRSSGLLRNRVPFWKLHYRVSSLCHKTAVASKIIHCLRSVNPRDINEYLIWNFLLTFFVFAIVRH
jgi:hypothetical protein